MLTTRKMDAFGATHPGFQRNRNEDAFLVDAERGLFAVADGLGGLPHGEVASEMAIAELSRSTDLDLGDLDELFNLINRLVRREGVKLSGATGIGTTLVAALVQEASLTIAHVGDCAAFLADGAGARQLTHDQTLAEQMRVNGEPSIPEYMSHILTQCVGQGGSISPEIIRVPFKNRARLILCSDGITKVIEDDEIISAIREAEDPKGLVDSLIDLANERGGPDNSTVVAVFR